MTTGRRLSDLKLDAAYEQCTAIARRQAKNFYYAFLALPKPKRDAICAVYAFMRHADDISDDESVPREQRRVHARRGQAGRPRAQNRRRAVRLIHIETRRHHSLPLSL